METKERPKFAKDPVCGMTVNVDKAAGKSPYDGKMYFFCSPGCQKKFEIDPGGYASGKIGPQKMA